jgi:ABC-type transporter Mla subunit MlaD
MATQFGCDPQVAAWSAHQLAQIQGEIDPPGQWLDSIDDVDVPTVGAALGEFSDAVSGASQTLSQQVGDASELFRALADGADEVDQALAGRLGLN